MDIRLLKLHLLNFNHFENKVVDFNNIDILDDHLTLFGSFSWLLFENRISNNLDPDKKNCKVTADIDFYGALLTVSRQKINNKTKVFIENSYVSEDQFNELIIQRIICVSSDSIVDIPAIRKRISKNNSINDPEVVSKYFNRQILYKLYMNSIKL